MKKLLILLSILFLFPLMSAIDITNWTDLNNVRNNLTANYDLVANLSSASAGYAGIGNSFAPILGGYAGIFNGNNNTISDLITTTPVGFTPTGLFNTLNAGSIVKDLIIYNSLVSAGASGWPTGTIAASGSGSLINVHVTGNITGSSQGYLGGLIGQTGATTIIDRSSFSGRIIGGSGRLGGLVGNGATAGLVINNSYSTGLLNSPVQYVGGILGLGGDPTTIQNTWSSMYVIGGAETGGIVGNMGGGDMRNCSTSGNVTGTSSVGGLAGNFVSSSYDSHATGNITGTSSVGGAFGITGRKTYQRNYATGNVVGTISDIGGFVGNPAGGRAVFNYNYATGNVNAPLADYVGGFGGNNNQHTMRDNYATGNVTGDQYVGGFVGSFTRLSGFGTIDNDYYGKGTITGNLNVGGIVGTTTLECTDTFWDVNTSGVLTDNCTSGTFGKTTLEMKNISTFSNAGWNIALTNTQINTFYPFFGYQDSNTSFIWLLSEPPNLVPYFTLIPSPFNATYPNGDVSEQFNATDPEFVPLNWGVNNSYFNIDATGLLTNSSILPGAVYNLNISINDTVNINSTLYTVTIFPVTSNCTVTSDTTFQLPDQVLITVECGNPEGTEAMFRNGVDVSGEIGVATSVGEGTYNYTFNVTGTANYTADQVNFIVTVLPFEAIDSICMDGELTMGDAAQLAGILLTIILVGTVLATLVLTFTGMIDISKIGSELTLDKLPAAIAVIGLTFLVLATMALVLGPTVCGTFGG